MPSFFDPGPGNPALDSAWHGEACRRSAIVLATEDEARRISGRSDPLESARALLALGPELVVIKRGVAGCFLVRKDEVHREAGLPVEARDATGAGDSLDAAVIDGFLRRLPLAALGTLANAVGAAKVQKLGTGRNMPTRDEVRAVLQALRRGRRRAPSHMSPPAPPLERSVGDEGWGEGRPLTSESYFREAMTWPASIIRPA